MRTGPQVERGRGGGGGGEIGQPRSQGSLRVERDGGGQKKGREKTIK